jgi:hypothetical protein
MMPSAIAETRCSPSLRRLRAARRARGRVPKSATGWKIRAKRFVFDGHVADS